MARPSRTEAKKRTTGTAGCKETRQPAAPRAAIIRPGATCDRCRKGTLVYNSVWQLVCSACGHVAESGGFS